MAADFEGFQEKRREMWRSGEGELTGVPGVEKGGYNCQYVRWAGQEEGLYGAESQSFDHGAIKLAGQHSSLDDPRGYQSSLVLTGRNW